MKDIKYINNFSGYLNYLDITNMPVNALAPGSQNVLIQDGAKIEPRAGMSYFGEEGTIGTQTNAYWTLAHRIHSNYDDFVNKQGVTIPIRVYYSGTTAVGDIIEVWLPVYDAGVATDEYTWYRINGGTPNIFLSTHKYYFAEWFDQATSVLQPELIFTYGGTAIGFWSGGFAPIISKTGTTLTTDATWASKGFISSPEGLNTVSFNGVSHNLTSGDFSTNTITIASTTGIDVDDIVFQQPYIQDTLGGTTTYDVCESINNQVYYIDWNQRNVYVSWDRNQVATIGNTVFSGTGLDDAILDGTYSGTSDNTYRVIISTTNTTSFTSGGEGNLNNAVWTTSSYSGTVGTHNQYNVISLADYSLFIGSAAANFSQNHLISGGTSNAQGIIVARAYSGIAATDVLAVKVLSGQFVNGETLTDRTTGTTTAMSSTFAQDWIQASKNGVTFNINTGLGSMAIAPLVTSSITLTDGLTIRFSNFFGHTVGDTFTLDIYGQNDTFQWHKNGGTLSSPTIITGSSQALSDGVTVTFSYTSGHTVGDSWTVLTYNTITRGWSNFTYSNPGRRPGQGFNLLLDSNGWTMKPQEKYMLINDAAGRFYDVELQLSADLLSESVTIKRLKSETQNKVLYPYLIGYMKNQLAILSSEKTFDILGRQKFLELQQLKTLSDAVRVDFETVDWEDADIKYYKRKIYFNIPRTTEAGVGACVFIWDDYKKYWHPPQVFGKRISLLSVINDKLIGHSYEKNESYELFVGENDLDIFPIDVRIIFPYSGDSDRYIQKSTDAFGVEGYIMGNPEIRYVINANVGGCSGQQVSYITPWDTQEGVCIPSDRASLGKSSLGYHGLGNDPTDVPPHYFFIERFDNMKYYQKNMEIYCNSLDQRWSITSIGTSINDSSINNETITKKPVY